MRIHEFTQPTTQVNEAKPAGFVQQGVNKLMGKLGSVKGQAGAEVGDRANQIYKAFTNYALRTGINPKNTLRTDLEAWFSSQGLTFPTKVIGDIYRLDLTNKNTSKKLWNAAAQETFKGGAGTGVNLGKQYGVKGPGQTGSSSAQATPSSQSANVDTEAGTANFERIKKAIPSMSPQQKHQIGQLLLGNPE